MHPGRAMGVVARVGACVGAGGLLLLSFFAFATPAAAQTALLDPVAPQVTMARGEAVALVVAELVIQGGDTVATDVSGRAVITYPDGSTATLEESSELTIEFVRTTADDYAVRMQQTLGRVWYAVTRTVGSAGRYEVRSAAMASVIRAGSGSVVSVAPGGETTVITLDGTVETSAGGASVTVASGESTTVAATGATPLPPKPAAVPTPPASTAPHVSTGPTATPTPTASPSPSTRTERPMTATFRPATAAPTLVALHTATATPRPTEATSSPTRAPTPKPTV